MKRVAVIGGGIVGSVCAFYLVKNGYSVTLFDDDKGQATKAAVGIICPWVSQRRNMDWYRLVDDGSMFYHQLIKDVKDSSFYERSGALLSNDRRLDAMYDLAISRRHENSIMGHVEILEGDSLLKLLPEGSVVNRALYIEGASRVDGALCVDTLISEAQEMGLEYIQQRVSFTKGEDDSYLVGNDEFDFLVLSSGAWLGELLPEYEVDVRPQKGQLIEFTKILEAKNYPLFIPKGEIDLLYKSDGTVVVGASHEDDRGFDLREDNIVLDHLQNLGQVHLPLLKDHKYDSVRVGSRAYTSDFLPFYGEIHDLRGVFAASGLGSSGLTSGPIIGYRLAKMIMGDLEPISIDTYVKRSL